MNSLRIKLAALLTLRGGFPGDGGAVRADDFPVRRHGPAVRRNRYVVAPRFAFVLPHASLGRSIFENPQADGIGNGTAGGGTPGAVRFEQDMGHSAPAVRPCRFSFVIDPVL